MIKGIIFDMDGTLIDSMYLWDNVGVDYLRANNIAFPPGLNEMLSHMGMVNIAEYFRSLGLNKTDQEIIDDLNSIVFNKYNSEVKLKPGVLEFLDKCRSEGLKMCVATANSRRLSEAALKNNGIFDYFEFVLTALELGADKDKPDIFIECARRLGLDIPEIAVYEDSLKAMITAKNAGFNVVGIYDHMSRGQVDEIKKICNTFKESWI